MKGQDHKIFPRFALERCPPPIFKFVPSPLIITVTIVKVYRHDGSYSIFDVFARFVHVVFRSRPMRSRTNDVTVGRVSSSVKTVLRIQRLGGHRETSRDTERRRPTGDQSTNCPRCEKPREHYDTDGASNRRLMMMAWQLRSTSDSRLPYLFHEKSPTTCEKVAQCCEAHVTTAGGVAQWLDVWGLSPVYNNNNNNNKGNAVSFQNTFTAG